MANVGFVFPYEICPFASDVVAAIAAKAIVQHKINGEYMDGEESLLRLYGMDPKEMQGYCIEAYKKVQRSNRTYRENQLRHRLWVAYKGRLS